MKCFLDTMILDWLTEGDEAEDLLLLLEQGKITGILAADNAYEVHRIPDEKQDKRERLQALIKDQFLPLSPTHLPLSGIAVSGLAKAATQQTIRLREALAKEGISGLDKNHLINAAKEGCTVFVTCDKVILKRRGAIRKILSLECLCPAELVQKVIHLGARPGEL